MFLRFVLAFAIFAAGFVGIGAKPADAYIQYAYCNNPYVSNGAVKAYCTFYDNAGVGQQYQAWLQQDSTVLANRFGYATAASFTLSVATSSDSVPHLWKACLRIYDWGTTCSGGVYLSRKA